MKLFQHRAQSAFSLPDEDNRDARLKDTLQQSYAVEEVSPGLRQRIADMAAFHEQQTVMHKPTRWIRHWKIALTGAAALSCLTWLLSLFVGVYTIPAVSMEPALMGHDVGPRSVSTFMRPTLLGHEEVLRYGGPMYTDTVHDCVLVNKWIYRLHTPRRSDVVVFLAPKEADADPIYSGVQQERVLVKRIIGVPGDTIEIKDGLVYRNDKPLYEFQTNGIVKVLDKTRLYFNGKPVYRYQPSDLPYSIKEPMDPNLEVQFHYATSWRGGPLKLKADEYWVMGDNRNDSNDSRYWGVLEESRIIGKVTRIIAPFKRWRSLP